MKLLINISIFLLSISVSAQSDTRKIALDFFGDSILLAEAPSVIASYQAPASENNIRDFYLQIASQNYTPLVAQLIDNKEKYKMDDWLFFQLIRKTVQQISPKAENYQRYTLFKWYLLAKSGYDVRLRVNDKYMLLYVQSNENVFEIPCVTAGGKQYVCLNYHDYNSNIDFTKESLADVNIGLPEAKNSFSYRLTRMPDGKPQDYIEKDLNFKYYNNDYELKVKMNPQVQTVLTNYPVLDYELLFNLPLSNGTRSSLITALKKDMKGMKQKDAIDYLMRFTRYAFPFEKDAEQFGKEKRMTPEQTLLIGNSDCEDRAALLYCLVKEMYNLPMIVITYPQHVTIGIKLDKPIGKTVAYQGEEYTICEPTPQKIDLRMGEMVPGLEKTPFQVAFAYAPKL